MSGCIQERVLQWGAGTPGWGSLLAGGVKTQSGAEMPGVGFCPGWHAHKPRRIARVFQERNAVWKHGPISGDPRSPGWNTVKNRVET